MRIFLDKQKIFWIYQEIPLAIILMGKSFHLKLTPRFFKVHEKI